MPEDAKYTSESYKSWKNPCIYTVYKWHSSDLIKCYIQFHWHLDTINSRFWIVNMLLQKFDTLLRKRSENDKNKFYDEKQRKMSKRYMKAVSN